MMNKILGVLFIGITTVAFACSETETHDVTINQAQNEQTKNLKEDVSVNRFAQLINSGKGQVLDVRTPEEWQEGIIEGAIKSNFYAEDFSSQLKNLDPNKPVYVYCKSGGRSGKAANQLKEMGFTVYNLEGGITAWKKEGKSTVK